MKMNHLIAISNTLSSWSLLHLEISRCPSPHSNTHVMLVQLPRALLESMVQSERSTTMILEWGQVNKKHLRPSFHFSFMVLPLLMFPPSGPQFFTSALQARFYSPEKKCWSYTYNKCTYTKLLTNLRQIGNQCYCATWQKMMKDELFCSESEEQLQYTKEGQNRQNKITNQKMKPTKKWGHSRWSSLT